MPIGAAGERTSGVSSRGDISDAPDRTAERFIPDPFHAPGAPLPDRRRGAIRPGWCHRVLGRLDRQIKLRGFRIEPERSRASYARAPDVADAAVVLHQSRIARNWSCAFVAPVPDPDAAEAAPVPRRASAGTSDPGGVSVRLDAWPLSPSGKLDRRALPPPMAVPSDRRPETRPLTAPEADCLASGRSCSAFRRRGPSTIFFELGGDSILAMIASSRARQAGVGITVRDISIAAPSRPAASASERSPSPSVESAVAARRVRERAARSDAALVLRALGAIRIISIRPSWSSATSRRGSSPPSTGFFGVTSARCAFIA